MATVDIQCRECGGSGLYDGCFELKGHPIVCGRCNGSGCEKLSYTPFVSRKKKRGIKAVVISRNDGEEKEIPYEEFLKKF